MGLIYHPDAELELIGAARFYEARVPRLGAQFLDAVDGAVSLILQAPDRWRIIEADVRRYSMPRFPLLHLLSTSTQKSGSPGLMPRANLGRFLRLMFPLGYDTPRLGFFVRRMRRLWLLPLASFFISNATFAASLGSTPREFRCEFGAPSFEEHLVRTSMLRWKPLRTREAVLAATKASALEVRLLDRRVCAVIIWCERNVSNDDIPGLVRRFLAQHYHPADFRKPSTAYPEWRDYKLSDGGSVLVNRHGKQDTVVIGNRVYWENIDVFDREAAKVRPPTSNH